MKYIKNNIEAQEIGIFEILLNNFYIILHHIFILYQCNTFLLYNHRCTLLKINNPLKMPQVCGESLGTQKFFKKLHLVSFKKFQNMINFKKTFKPNLMITLVVEAFINSGNNCNAGSNFCILPPSV